MHPLTPKIRDMMLERPRPTHQQMADALNVSRNVVGGLIFTARRNKEPWAKKLKTDLSRKHNSGIKNLRLGIAFTVSRWMAVECPKCGAGIGEPCEGAERRKDRKNHAARRRLIFERDHRIGG